MDDEDLDIDLDEDIDLEEVNTFDEKLIDINFNEERETKISSPVMTIYEKIKILAERVKQLDNNYSTTIPDEVRAKNLNKSIDIAILEFDLRKIPNCNIIRTLPDGSYEKWNIKDFLRFP
jgi:DNA-directed RNA polymerase subunit K/omega